MTKPRITLASSGRYECTDGVVTRAGDTPRQAYDFWLLAAIRDAQERRQAPPAPRRRTSKALTVKAPGPVTVVASGAKPAPYAGPVTVVPGTQAARKAWRPDAVMRVAAERAAAAQPPVGVLAAHGEGTR